MVLVLVSVVVMVLVDVMVVRVDMMVVVDVMVVRVDMMVVVCVEVMVVVNSTHSHSEFVKNQRQVIRRQLLTRCPCASSIKAGSL